MLHAAVERMTSASPRVPRLSTQRLMVSTCSAVRLRFAVRRRHALVRIVASDAANRLRWLPNLPEQLRTLWPSPHRPAAGQRPDWLRRDRGNENKHSTEIGRTCRVLKVRASSSARHKRLQLPAAHKACSTRSQPSQFRTDLRFHGPSERSNLPGSRLESMHENFAVNLGVRLIVVPAIK